MRHAWLVIVVAAAACKAGPAKRFRAKAAMTVEVDGFSLPIPDGYRNLAELLDQDRAMRVQDLVPVEASVVVTEQRPPDELWIAVLSFATDVVATAPACDKLAGDAAREAKLTPPPTAIETTALGPACTFALDYPAEHDAATGDTPARRMRAYWLPHAGRMLLLECCGTDTAARDRACKDLLGGATARD